MRATRRPRHEISTRWQISRDEPEAVRAALTRARGNVSQAATDLGMRRAKIYEILRAKGVRAEDYR